MTVTENKMNGCRVDSRRERPVSSPLDDGACQIRSINYIDLPSSVKKLRSQKAKNHRAVTGAWVHPRPPLLMWSCFIRTPHHSNPVCSQVDWIDYIHFGGVNWHLCSQGLYLYRKEAGRKIWLHREINKTPKGLFTDHKNRQTLDNRRSNLRTANPAQNAHNAKGTGGASGYKGVNKNGNRWRAQIRINGKTTHLGNFKSQRQAAKAYDEAAKKHFGEYAWTNEKQWQANAELLMKGINKP